MSPQSDHVREEVNLTLDGTVVPAFEEATTVLCISSCLLERFSLHRHLLVLKVCRVHQEAWASTELLMANA
jgi:hypothetical protein